VEDTGIRAIKLQEVKGGELIGLIQTELGWNFDFANKLTVECYGGWRIVMHEGEGKTLLGMRDLSNSENPFEEIMKHLTGFELVAIFFNTLTDTLLLQMMKDRVRISLDLFTSSVKHINWKIIGEDFVDSDQANIIKNL